MKKYALYLFAFVVFFIKSVTAQNEMGKPNIIFIFADDLGYGDVGCYGQQKIETPHMDALAKNGLRFTQFYSGSTVCAPARVSLLTGLHTGHTPVRGNKSFQPEGQTPVPGSVTSFASILQQQGYSTAAFGKWGLGYITTSGDPNKQGFDRFYGYNCQSLAHDYYPDHLWNNHDRIDLPGNNQSNQTYSGDLIHAEALNFIKSDHKDPFFLFLPYTLPHAEVIAPHDSIYSYYIKKFKEQPDTAKRLYDGRFLEPYPHAAFAAMVARLDRYVGEIVRLVTEKGISKNTIIIFGSDNGPHREGGGDPEYFNSNGIYRGIKRDLYEGGIRVPFIASWPGKIKPGVSGQPAALWDLYPTFLELAGVKQAAKVDGLSLVPTLLGTGQQQQHDYLYWEFHENDGRQALRWKQWKAVKLGVGKSPDPPIELYDLDKDPSEQNNIAASFPEIASRMNAWIREAHQPNPDWPLLYSEKNKGKMIKE